MEYRDKNPSLENVHVCIRWLVYSMANQVTHFTVLRSQGICENQALQKCNNLTLTQYRGTLTWTDVRHTQSWPRRKCLQC